jgi:nitrogen fixation/metabolism regulation signal transduction histidine kinase
MRDEIWAGLKNALERGESLDKAVQSFISAGYNPNEVQEAAASIGQGASGAISAQPTKPQQTTPLVKQPQTMQPTSKPQQNSSETATAMRSSDLQPVKIAQDEVKDVAVKDIKTDSKILYVPSEQPLAPQIQKINKDYIPYDGTKSTRKKRLIILVIFLIFLVILLILAIVFYNDLLKFINSFYTK